LSVDEEAKLFSALGENDLVKQIVTTALHTGMRRGEIFNLKWFDVDFNRQMIHVQESKSGKKRLIPVNETVKVLLGNLQRQSEFVFPSPKREED
jgi:integrase